MIGKKKQLIGDITKVLELTDAAVSQAIKRASDEGRDTIRVGVTSGGCVGFEYVFQFDDTVDSSDHILDYGKFKIVINEVSLPFLENATLDYIYEGLNEQFKIYNPDETASCGCGVSIGF